MALWTWWPGDARPTLPPLDRFHVSAVSQVDTLAPVVGLTIPAIEERLRQGHRCYVAWVGCSAVAYGWLATSAATIGELDVQFQLAEDRYLWDFVTLPAWRGQGVYPRLLQAILASEGDQRAFWIINAPENVASARGIAKAGFHEVGNLAFNEERRAALQPAGPPHRAARGARLLGVPLLPAAPVSVRTVSPCWCCVTDAVHEDRPASCWPADQPQGPICTCAAPVG